LPVLVRLALLVKGSTSTVAELYDAAASSLLGRGSVANESLDWASALCVRTYWRSGIRTLRYRNSADEPKLQTLLQCGLLVPVAEGSPLRVPDQVKFFHDSMQAYLTARGLFLLSESAPSWGDVLLRAAGNPLFLEQTDAGAGSELFAMCTATFGQQERLADELRSGILTICARLSLELSARMVGNWFPARIREDIADQLKTQAPHAALVSGLAKCNELDSLCVVFARMAADLWSYESKDLDLGP
jgi:hypothetical protein